MIASMSTTREKKALKKKIFTSRLPQDLFEKIKNFIYWTPGMTIERAFKEGMELYIREKEALNGGPFKKRDK